MRHRQGLGRERRATTQREPRELHGPVHADRATTVVLSWPLAGGASREHVLWSLCCRTECRGEGLAGRKSPDLLLAPCPGALRGSEGDPRAHRLLLYRSRGTPKLPGDLTRRCSRLRQRPERRQFTGAPGGAVIRWTSCHYSSPEKNTQRRGRAPDHTLNPRACEQRRPPLCVGNRQRPGPGTGGAGSGPTARTVLPLWSYMTQPQLNLQRHLMWRCRKGCARTVTNFPAAQSPRPRRPHRAQDQRCVGDFRHNVPLRPVS